MSKGTWPAQQSDLSWLISYEKKENNFERWEYEKSDKVRNFVRKEEEKRGNKENGGVARSGPNPDWAVSEEVGTAWKVPKKALARRQWTC